MTQTPGPALVVGGSSGIGAAVAERYRAASVEVVVWDIDGEPDLRCDIADPTSVTEAMAGTIERVGAPTEVTVTAGVGHARMLLDLDPDEWDRVQRINTRGPLLVMQAAARAMMDAGVGGSMVATSSISARLVDRSMAAYCASKAALAMVVQVAAMEWAPNDIRVNAIAPGVTETRMLGPAPRDSGWLAAVQRRTALGRLGAPDDIAEAIAGLHAMSWVTGQVLEADGGLGRYSPIDSFGEHRR
jgi:NAD(P)-dependent dehydrogenase (short-subunit alcohol dehydrogenase family)